MPMKLAEAREAVPKLLTRIRSHGLPGEIKANWIEDVYSEVLKGIETGELPEADYWLERLDETCRKQLVALRDEA